MEQPAVKISVVGGVAYVDSVPPGIAVQVTDHDVDRASATEVHTGRKAQKLGLSHDHEIVVQIIEEAKRLATSTNTVNPAFVYQYQGEAVAATNEQARILSAALAKLADRDRLIIMLRMQEFPLETIGELLDLSRERVRQLEERAHETLRAVLSGMGIHTLAEIP